MTEIASDSGTKLIPFDYENSAGGDDAAELEAERLYELALEADDPDTRALSELLGGHRSGGQPGGQSGGQSGGRPGGQSGGQSGEQPASQSAEQQWAITQAIGHEFGADPDELAIAALNEGDEFEGGDALLDGGYGTLVDTLAAGLDVRLGWQVAEIIHDESTVIVRSTTGAELRATAAVVTLPVGVLTSGAVQFLPPLPAAKDSALAALPSGLLDKLWLTFDDVFWNPDVDVINFIDPDNPGLWAQWVNGYRAFGTPTLLGFNSSSVARTVAGWSDDEVVASAVSALSRMG